MLFLTECTDQAGAALVLTTEGCISTTMYTSNSRLRGFGREEGGGLEVILVIFHMLSLSYFFVVFIFCKVCYFDI